MRPSIRYRELQRALHDLRKALLPGSFNETGSYRSPRRVHVRAISFRILVHAEIESYLEDRALELMSTAWGLWQTDGVPSDVTLGLIAFSEVKTTLAPKKLGGDPKKQTAYDEIHTPLEKANNAWRRAHQTNHGVKEENVLSLLLPLGVRASDLDNTLLADLSSYGSQRGMVAHGSQARVKQFVDPATEYQRAVQLVADISDLDQVLNHEVSRVMRLGTAGRR